MVTVPFSVNLLALLARLSSACRSRVWSACMVPRSGGQSTTMRLPFFVAIGSMVLATSPIKRHQRERFEVKLHPPRLDLGQIENVVDQGEQMPARAEHAVERLEVLLEALGILPQHLGDADDGVERCAQLVAHVGEELRLVLARDSASWRLLSWISSNSRTFSIAITAWSAKVVDKLNLLVGEWLHLVRRSTNYANRTPSRSSGTPSMVRIAAQSVAPPRMCTPDRPAHPRTVSVLPSSNVRPTTFPRPAFSGIFLTNSLVRGAKP